MDSTPTPLSIVSSHDLPSDFICPICHNNDIRLWMKTNCNHIFCKICIEKWMGKQAEKEKAQTCPMCRFVLVPKPPSSRGEEEEEDHATETMEEEEDEEEYEEHVLLAIQRFFNRPFLRTVARSINAALRLDSPCYTELLDLHRRTSLDFSVRFIESCDLDDICGQDVFLVGIDVPPPPDMT